MDTSAPGALSPRLSIRRAVPDDAPAIARLYGEPEVQANLLQMPFPSEHRLREWLLELQPRTRTDLHLVALRDGELVAMAGLDAAAAHLRRRHVMGLGMAVARAAQGQGVGRSLMRELLAYADRWAQVLRIELNVYVDNAAAISLYRRFDFRIEGTLRGYAMRDGAYVDVHAMARLHPDAPRLAWHEAGAP